MGKTMRAIGLMSGTSMDGIDVALIETDGEDLSSGWPAARFPMTRRASRDLRRAARGSARATGRTARPRLPRRRSSRS